MINRNIKSINRPSYSNTFLNQIYFNKYDIDFSTMFGLYFGWLMILVTLNTSSYSGDSLTEAFIKKKKVCEN